MSNSFIPQKYKVLSGSALKVIATLAMFIDHTAHVLMQKNPVPLFQFFDVQISAYFIMRAIGRIAFPIFVFLLVEGFLHTRSRKQYAMRLLIFAAISEIPWNLEHTGKIFMPTSQSVFVSLFFALLGLCALDHLLHGEEDQRPKWAAALVGIFVALTLVRCDYGARALALAMAVYLLREQPVVQAVLGSSILGDPLFVSVAFIPINMYNGKRGFIHGRVLQLLFYAIYPAHMLLLYYIKLTTIGY